MLAPVWGYPEGYPDVDDPPGLLRYPGGVCALVRRCIVHLLPEIVKEGVLVVRFLGGINWDPNARPEVELVLPKGRAV